MFYYKTIYGYESRNVKSTDPTMQEISAEEYFIAIAELERMWAEESAALSDN